MNIRIHLVAAAIAGWTSAPHAAATIVGTGLISQPLYLGGSSQPDRIPLGRVVYNANHGYGSHSAIFQSNPCQHGHFLADGRPEYEQNLAVLFGISCELSDSTQMAGCTATFRIRDTRVPSNAPYTRERVFAASLQTLLLHSWGMRKGAPLTVVALGDGIPKPNWVAKYEGEYFHPDHDPEKPAEFRPLSVPGVRIDESSIPGVTYLIFDGVAADPKIKPKLPAFIPFKCEGECGDDGTAELVPVWCGDSWPHPLAVIAFPSLPYYEKCGWNAAFSVHDAVPYQPPPNPVIARNQFHLDDGDRVLRVAGGEISPDQLAALVFSSVATARPTAEHPFKVLLDGVVLPGTYQDQLRHAPGWTDGRSCEFVVDPATLKLRKGTVPGYVMESGAGGITFSMIRPKEQMFYGEDPAPPWAADSLKRIADTLPIVTGRTYEETMRNFRAKFGGQHPSQPLVRDEQIRIMLAMWQYGDERDFLETLWWRDNDRVIRALAACLTNWFHREGRAFERIDFPSLLEGGPFNRWEAEMRQQELDSMLQQRFSDAVAKWANRCVKEPSDASGEPPGVKSASEEPDGKGQH